MAHIDMSGLVPAYFSYFLIHSRWGLFYHYYCHGCHCGHYLLYHYHYPCHHHSHHCHQWKILFERSGLAERYTIWCCTVLLDLTTRLGFTTDHHHPHCYITWQGTEPECMRLGGHWFTLYVLWRTAQEA